jgi:hypothetical protein
MSVSILYLLKRGLRMTKTSKLVAIAIMGLLCVSVFAGSAIAMEDFGRGLHPLHSVEVDLAGSMRLEWYQQTDNITIEKNFTAKVPVEITAGKYDATFKGFARVDEGNIEFNGAIATENGTFMAEFAVPNKYNIPTPSVPMGMCRALGNLTLEIIEIAPIPPFQYEYIQVVGRVTDYGSSPASGILNANAKISNSTIDPAGNVSQAHVFWIPLSGEIPHPWEVGNFTYSFYKARLINTTKIALNYSGNDFYISGLWNVMNVTFSYYGINDQNFQKTESYVRQNATGELKVYGNWMNFTLSIAGFDDVKGSIKHFVTHAKVILDGDVLGHGRVDIYDLVHVARLIGSTAGAPQCGGISGFENVESADVNFDFQVDVYDLVTVATQIGQTS